MSTQIPCLAIVGRPNVGKSTLFNRLCRRSIALVYNEPGVTRDCRRERIDFYGFDAELMDTPGLMDLHASPSLFRVMETRTWQALSQADGILFLVDGQSGLLPADQELARLIQKTGKPVWVGMNKMESSQLRYREGEAYSLGFDRVFPISAEHGDGLTDLAQSFLKILGPSIWKQSEKKGADCFETTEELILPSENSQTDSIQIPLRLAIVGRPNVGKSTLFNYLLGNDHQLVDDQPGITRDSVLIPFEYQGRSIHLMDTAGIRKRTQIQEPIERLSVQQAYQAIRQAHVVVLLVDGSEMTEQSQVHQQDITLAAYSIDQGKPLIIAVNKVDCLPHREQFLKSVPQFFESSLHSVKNPYVVGIAARTGLQVDALMAGVGRVYQQWKRRLSTAELNRWFQKASQEYPPPATAGSRPRLKYISQIGSCPPTFLIHGTRTFQVPKAYTQYLTHHFQSHFDMKEILIRLLYRKIQNPYDSRNSK
jgi:GTP-binding protein